MAVTKQKFYYVDDVCEMLDVGKRTAYSIIKKLNAELNDKGFFTFAGRVSAKYFEERFNLEVEQ